MKRQPFYPKIQGERPEWHINFATKLPGYGTTLTLSPGEVDNGVADNLILGYGLGGWITTIRENATACTSSLETLEDGVGSAIFVFPTLQLPVPPDLPAGITGVKPGALQRTFDLAQTIKRRAGYTEAIGLDLGIVGPEAPVSNTEGGASGPRITVTVIQGVGHENGRVKFIKDGHVGVWIESRRGAGDWEFLTTTDKSPFIDSRALLVPGQAEVREYRARFWDQGQPNGDWSDVAKVTISP